MPDTNEQGAGRLLAERLGLRIVGVEGHDLKVGCIACKSSDAGRVHAEKGIYHCYACGKNLNAFDLAKVVLGDHKVAIDVLVAIGIFDPPSGNGKPASEAEIIDEVARAKGTTAAGFYAMGAMVKDGVVLFPTFRLNADNAERISHFYIDPKIPGDKGKNAKGKPAGIFLPAEVHDGKGQVRRPKAGETWCICEGPKNAAAYATLGYRAVGLNGKSVKKEFLPGFVAGFRGVDVVLVPDGDLQSVEAFKKLGAALHGTAKSVRLASLPYGDELRGTGGDDVRDVLKKFEADGAQLVRDAIAASKPIGKDGEVEEKIDFGIITAAELLRKDCSVEFYIPGILAAAQHHILGGPLKCCKTLIASDLAISLAIGGRFLDHFDVPRPVRTILLCGEAGWPVFQENIRRISVARGATEKQLENLLVGVRLPKFGNKLQEAGLAEFIAEQKAEVVILDCAYRCIPGDQVSNQFAMGEVLDSIGSTLEAVNATLMLLCHTPKHIPAGNPLGLDDVAFAGFAEFAAQWFIVNRRKDYQPGSGRHELWAVVGGRAGHSGSYSIDIDEGEFHPDQDRGWMVAIAKPDEARQQQWDERQKARETKLSEKREEVKKRILDAAAKFKTGETASIIRDRTA